LRGFYFHTANHDSRKRLDGAPKPAEKYYGGAMIFSGKIPTNIGVQAGQLAPCSNKPNCVSSQETRPSHMIEPLKVNCPSELAMAKMKSAIASITGTKIVTSQAGYLHVECKTPLLGFVDDLEVNWDQDKQFFHVRSASRLGYSDMGANRKRIETLRKLLSKAE
jgi:uncharacterized protein (DUF1499 family)